ncbi:MAG: hypothetical protein WCI92_09955 [Bacteroidota bacterium]
MYLNTALIKKTINDLLIKISWSAPTNTEEEIAVSRYLKKIAAFSTIIFVFTALAFRFLLNLQTSALLRLYSYHFRYRLFDITFSSLDGNKWPISRILIVFGLGYLAFMLAGIFLMNKFKNIHNVDWKTRLILTWTAFLLVNSVPAAIIAGVFSVNSFGIIFHWLAMNTLIRLAIGLGALLMMFLSRNFWVFLFLKATSSRFFLTDEEPMDLYIMHVFTKSWLYGFLILLFFNWPLRDIFWPVFFLSLGIVALPIFVRPVAHEDISIRKSDREMFSSPYAWYFIVGILLLIRIAGTLFTIQF